MKAVSKFLAGAAVLAVAAGGLAAPAAAQYYPPYGGGGYGNGNVIVGAILDSILRGGPARGYGYGNGYGNGYGYGGNNGYQNERYAIDQCARAAEDRLNRGYGGGYRNYGYAAPVRVSQIERVEVTRNGNMRVYGWAGQQGWQGNYGGYGGYNAPYGGGYGNAVAPQIRFSCKVDRRSGRITDLDVNRARYGYRY